MRLVVLILCSQMLTYSCGPCWNFFCPREEISNPQLNPPVNQLSRDDIDKIRGGLIFNLNEAVDAYNEAAALICEYYKPVNMQWSTDQQKIDAFELSSTQKIEDSIDPNFSEIMNLFLATAQNYAKLGCDPGQECCQYYITWHGVLERKDGHFFWVKPKFNAEKKQIIGMEACDGTTKDDCIEQSREYLMRKLDAELDNRKSDLVGLLRKMFPARKRMGNVKKDDIDTKFASIMFTFGRSGYKLGPDPERFGPISESDLMLLPLKSVAMQITLKTGDFALIKLIGYDDGLDLKDSQVFQYVVPDDYLEQYIKGDHRKFIIANQKHSIQFWNRVAMLLLTRIVSPASGI